MGIQDLFEEAEYSLKQTVLKRLADTRQALEGKEDPHEEEEKKDDAEDDLGKLRSTVLVSYYGPVVRFLKLNRSFYFVNKIEFAMICVESALSPNSYGT